MTLLNTAMIADAVRGYSPSKPPCRTLGATNHARTGLGVLGGVSLQEGDRVLLIGQSKAAHNGPWVATARSGGWQRPPDFAEDRFVHPGVEFRVLAGTHAGSLWYLSSPAAGAIVLDQTALTFSLATGGGAGGGGGGPLPPETPWSTRLDFSEPGFQRVDNGGSPGPLWLVVDPFAPVVAGVERVVLIPAGEATALYAPAAWGEDATEPAPTRPNGRYPTHWDAYDPTKPYRAASLALGDGTWDTAGRVLGKSLLPAPYVVSATINLASPDQIVVEYSRPCYAQTVADLALDGGAAQPSSILDGQGTVTHTYQLTEVALGDPTSFLVESGREVQALDGALLTVSSTPVDIIGGGPAHTTANLDDLSLRIRHDLDNGSPGEGNPVSAWNSVGGTSSIDFTASGGARPTCRVADHRIDFNGTTNVMTSTSTVSDLIGVSGENWELYGRIRATTTNTAVNYNTSDAILSDGPAGYLGLLIVQVNATHVKLVLYAYDTTSGGAVYLHSNGGATPADGQIVKNDWFYFDIRHDGSTATMAINGVDVHSVPLTTIDGVAGALTLGRNADDDFANCGVWELAGCHTMQTAPKRAAQRAYYAGLPPP